MTPFEHCLATLLKVLKEDEPDGLDSADRCVQIYLASPDSPHGVAHPCDDLAEALMNMAPDSELKGDVLDKLFQIGRCDS